MLQSRNAKPIRLFSARSCDLNFIESIFEMPLHYHATVEQQSVIPQPRFCRAIIVRPQIAIDIKIRLFYFSER